MNLFKKFFFGTKIWGIYASKAGCLQPCSFFIITDQYSRQGWVIFAIIDHCKIHRSKLSSNVALGAPLNFKYFLINIKLPKCLKCGQCILLWQYWIKIWTELRSMLGKFENKDQEILVLNLWRQNLHLLAYKLHTLTDYRL